MPGSEVVAGGIGPLVAASVVVGLMAGCTAPPPGIGGAVASDPPQAVSEPAAAATPAPLPDIPRQSAALDDQPAAPPEPTRLEVPALGIDVSVRPVGLDNQGRMGLFEDPAIAAWYRWGPAPASAAGSTVIAAHVDSLTYDVLPFARLKDAAPGTEVVVTDAAGERHAYAVESMQVIEKADVDWDAAFDRSGAPRLTLVTCGGEFDYANRRYLSNLVVTAVPAT
ncbi:LPXTG-site transpeptidase (sortase) family protein [Agromyces flavus]|uniref:LPXTG-site transpeptidase (Sortase) family protein n=1 Tax=Agromyces flavus TaxID=589382 RepID=A0A1H1TEQ7_9MICO|nr:class F sortase [Agromyces flavus]MCP2368438.1 LPXTG-site transpeptidase (sortase) family protein [Agromyces flavus]GGI47898.1 class F sortase [Agromyces flavus]SDS58668.1 LPXTG-site transpeptidase (sortase) family protein [Agromyces flavus]